jgi:hypothetical protein
LCNNRGDAHPIQRLNASELSARHYDVSGMGEGGTVVIVALRKPRKMKVRVMFRQGNTVLIWRVQRLEAFELYESYLVISFVANWWSTMIFFGCKTN